MQSYRQQAPSILCCPHSYHFHSIFFIFSSFSSIQLQTINAQWIHTQNNTFPSSKFPITVPLTAPDWPKTHQPQAKSWFRHLHWTITCMITKFIQVTEAVLRLYRKAPAKTPRATPKSANPFRGSSNGGMSTSFQ